MPLDTFEPNCSDCSSRLFLHLTVGHLDTRTLGVPLCACSILEHCIALFIPQHLAVLRCLKRVCGACDVIATKYSTFGKPAPDSVHPIMNKTHYIACLSWRLNTTISASVPETSMYCNGRSSSAPPTSDMNKHLLAEAVLPPVGCLSKVWHLVETLRR